MAHPTIDWDIWSAPTIYPSMKAVIHFPSGDIEYSDDDIASVSFELSAFDTNAILFGAPTPGTGTLDLVDYDQALNPANNKELQAGINIDLYLGTHSTDGHEFLGENLIASVKDPQWVTWQGSRFYAVPATTTIILPTNTEYLLTFDYVLSNGSTGSVAKSVSNYITEDYTINIALLNTSIVQVSNLQLRERLIHWEPYGCWIAQEWTYDSEGHTASVDIADRMSDLLLLDNRRDGPAPAKSVDLLDTTEEYLSLYMTPEVTFDSDIALNHFFYEETPAKTVNNLVTALSAMLFFLPDGSLVLSQANGVYDTDITLSDEDIFSYNIKQTSAVTWDSVSVVAYNTSLAQGSSLASFSNITFAQPTELPLSASKVFSVDYISTDTSFDNFVPYKWYIDSIVYGTYDLVQNRMLSSLEVLGSTVTGTALTFTNTNGTSPYTISDNMYIQSADQATAMSNALDAFLDLEDRVVDVTLRGGYGLWLGAILTLNSAEYAINSRYIITNLSFSYDGSISTTLTLQRI